MASPAVLYQAGDHASRPASGSGCVLYSCTDHDLVYRDDGSSWTTFMTLVGGAGGDIATDTIWDAAGDIVYGTGANTGARLAIGTAGQVLKVNAGATAPEWGAAGASTAQPLAILSYAPGSPAALVQTSGTMGDADATNLAITATTGDEALVVLSGVARANSGAGAGDRGLWGVRIGSSTPAGGGPTYVIYVQAALGANYLVSVTRHFRITGLTPGSNTFKWGIAGGGAGSMGLYVDSTNPAIMEVWDLP